MIIKELALDFMHTCSGLAQDKPWNSEKQKDLTFKPTPSLKTRNRKMSVGSDNLSPLKCLSDPTEFFVVSVFSLEVELSVGSFCFSEFLGMS